MTIRGLDKFVTKSTQTFFDQLEIGMEFLESEFCKLRTALRVQKTTKHREGVEGRKQHR